MNYLTRVWTNIAMYVKDPQPDNNVEIINQNVEHRDLVQENFCYI